MDEEQYKVLKDIHYKVDDVKNKLHNIELVQVRMEADLKYHIRRTDLLEEKVVDIDDKLKPVENAKNAMMGFGKILAFLSGVLLALISIFRYFFNKN